MASGQSVGALKRVLLLACAMMAALAAMIAVATPESALAQGQGACGLHTLHGSYIFAASGYNIVAGVAQPKAIVEAIDFNGDGTLSVPAVTVSINGTVTQGLPGVGVYTLGDDCRGTVSFTPGPSFDVFVDHPGKQAQMIQTNPGTVFQGTVTKVSN